MQTSKSKRGDRANKLLQYVEQNPGKTYRHYADYAAGVQRLNRSPKNHFGYGVVGQLVRAGRVQLVADTREREGSGGYLKVFPVGAVCPEWARPAK